MSKKCKGCGSSVVNALSCLSCGISSHPGCLSRCNHPWRPGSLIDCSLNDQSNTPRTSLDDNMLTGFRKLIQEELKNSEERMKRIYENQLSVLKNDIKSLSDRLNAVEKATLIPDSNTNSNYIVRNQ